MLDTDQTSPTRIARRVDTGDRASCRHQGVRVLAQSARYAFSALPALALAGAVMLVLPPAQLAWIDAPAAEAKARKGSAIRGAKTAAARRRQIERDLARARARVIPARLAGVHAPHITPLPEPNPSRGQIAEPTGRAVIPLTLKDKKAAVLAADAGTLRRIGRHVMVGYHAAQQLMPLIERAAIGGVFVTSRNVRRRGKAALAQELAGIRKAAEAAGRAEFWIATDQEGGTVSRLSPPLPYQPALPTLLRRAKPEAREEAIQTFAEKQAKALAELGINLNFAPVADLNHNVKAPGDRHTRIRYRAIAEDPAVVTSVARTYCDVLAKSNIQCTLKHFPGLGRIAADTHITSAHLTTPSDVLETSDWIPFRRLLGETAAFVMVGHPHLDAVDATRPASTSPAVIQKLLRENWKFDGVVVTDDLAMGAIKRHFPGGMGAAAVEALNAGADIALIGSDGDEIYDVLYALIAANDDGRLTADKLAASASRQSKAAAAMHLATPSASAGEQTAAPSKTTTARQ